MAANPQLLPQVLTTMAQSDPELVQGIMQNQEAFMQIMQGGAAAQGGDDEGGDEGVARIELTQVGDGSCPAVLDGSCGAEAEEVVGCWAMSPSPLDWHRIIGARSHDCSLAGGDGGRTEARGARF